MEIDYGLLFLNSRPRMRARLYRWSGVRSRIHQAGKLLTRQFDKIQVWTCKKIRLNLILKKRCFVLYSNIIHDVCLVGKNLLLNSWAVLTSLFAKTHLLVFDNQKFEFEVNLKVVIKNSWNGDEQETNWAKCECCCFKGFGVRNGSGEPLRKDIIGAVSDRFCDLLL